METNVRKGQTTSLSSPLINASDVCMKFKLCMPSSSSNLKLTVKDNSTRTLLQSLSGSKGAGWNHVYVPIQHSGPFKVSIYVTCNEKHIEI